MSATFADFDCFARDNPHKQNQSGLYGDASSAQIRPGLLRRSRRLQNEAVEGEPDVLEFQYSEKSLAEAPTRAAPLVLPLVLPSQPPSIDSAPAPGRLDQRADVNNTEYTEGPAPSVLPLPPTPSPAPSVCKRPYKLLNSKLLASRLFTSDYLSGYMTSMSFCKWINASNWLQDWVEMKCLHSSWLTYSEPTLRKWLNLANVSKISQSLQSHVCKIVGQPFLCTLTESKPSTSDLRPSSIVL